MDKPQTQTTPTVEQSKPTESKPEVKPEPKEETGKYHCRRRIYCRK